MFMDNKAALDDEEEDEFNQRANSMFGAKASVRVR